MRAPVHNLLLILALILCADAVHAQEHGLLLGLRHPEPVPKPLPYYAGGGDSLARPAYQTLLIAERDGQVSFVGTTNDLLIPRNDTLWQVGVKRSIYNNWVEDFVWAAPEHQSPTFAGIQPFNGEYCDGHRIQTIQYAGPAYLSLDQRSAGYCEGAAHPWFFNTLAVVPLDSTTHQGLPITAVLGEGAYDTFRQHAQTFLSSLPSDEQRQQYAPTPDAANWGLVRQQGRWAVIGRLDAASEAVQGTFADVTLDSVPPSALADSTALPIAWDRVEARVPEALDAVVTPDQRLLIILGPNNLSVHPLRQDDVDLAMLRLHLTPESRIVMTQAATGSRLQQWIQRFNHQTDSIRP